MKNLIITESIFILTLMLVDGNTSNSLLFPNKQSYQEQIRLDLNSLN